MLASEYSGWLLQWIVNRRFQIDIAMLRAHHQWGVERLQKNHPERFPGAAGVADRKAGPVAAGVGASVD